MAEQSFSLTFSNLAEGIYPDTFIIKDNHGLVGKGNHILIIDKTPPTMPVVKTPLVGAIITDSDDEDAGKAGVQIHFSGIAESGSTVTLFSGNGTSTTVALPDGTFNFSDITLQKGKQNFTLFATDAAGNESQHAIVPLIYDNPPVVDFINPKSFGGLSQDGTISWNIVSPDNNPLSNINISYRYNGNAFKTLVSNAKPKGTYDWNISALPELNDYQLQISANDGFVTVNPIVNFSIDRTPPSVNAFTLNLLGENSFTGSGVASDALSGIAYVEYSIAYQSTATSSPWYETLLTNGPNQQQASFSMKYPFTLPDGLYTIYVRALDAAGNLSPEVSKSLRIDTTPPRIGSFFLSEHNLNIVSDDSGTLSAYKNSTVNFAVSLEDDAKNVSLFVGSTSFALTQDNADGLWKAQISLGVQSTSTLSITASDHSGNMSSKRKRSAIFPLIDPGVITGETGNAISGVQLLIWKLNGETNQYEKFSTPFSRHQVRNIFR